ncbi:TIGR04222 domain-containing membrane protein [Streptomyces lydicus]
MAFAACVYAVLGVSSLVLVIGTVVLRLRTPSVRRADALAHDVWETAFLAGGPARVVDAAVAAMHEDGRLTVGGPGVVTVRQATARDAVEAAVLDAVARTPGGALATLRAEAMRSPAVQDIGDRLAARGLMRHPRLGRGWRGWGMAGRRAGGGDRWYRTARGRAAAGSVRGGAPGECAGRHGRRVLVVRRLVRLRLR